MNAVDFIFEKSKSLDKDLLLGRYERISYRDIYKKIENLSDYLSLQGYKNEKIGLIAENSIFFIASYFGIMKSGNMVVPLPTKIDSNEAQRIFNLCEMKLIFAQKKFSDLAKGEEITVINEDDIEKIFSGPKIQKASKLIETKDNDLAAIIFTSSSTGESKGVMISHGNIIANTNSIISYLEIKEGDIQMVVLPFYYCFGASLLHTHARQGASIVINNTFILTQTVLDDLLKYKCTSFSGVPGNYQILLRKSRFKETKFPDLRYMTQAGGKLAEPFIREIRQAHPEIKFIIMYGQTEATARLSYLPPEMLEKKMGSMGRGIPEVKIEVLNSEGRQIKPGETGEVAASGKNIMLGYYKDEEETKKVIRNGKLYTGDLATVDEDGYVFIQAREKHMIKSGGSRTSPKEIENIICEMPEVVSCAVIAAYDELLGESPKAIVVLSKKQGLSENDIIRYCRKKLAPYKVPKKVVFLDRMPLNSSGKDDIRKLSDDYGDFPKAVIANPSPENSFLENKVQEIISLRQYSLQQKDKEKLILPLLKGQMELMKEKNPYLKSMHQKLKTDFSKIEYISDLPAIPVQMFKKFDLTACDKSEIIRVIKSSSTTGQSPSQVPLDKVTAGRQTKALVSILSSYLGTKRRPFLVIDSEATNRNNQDLTARGAGIRGLANFSKSTTYALDETEGGGLKINLQRVKDFFEKHKGEDIFVFGFTFMIWTEFIQKLPEIPEASFGDVRVFHSGGWKKLKDQTVSEKVFSEKVAEVFNTKPGNIHNFYGMAEQTGIIFVDCEEGHKHIPNFADVIIRNPRTLEECKIDESGLIEVLSILGNSYPSQALLTEDIGVLKGIDNCACGRKGKYFDFVSRVEKVEIRGCGDTFAEKKRL